MSAYPFKLPDGWNARLSSKRKYYFWTDTQTSWQPPTEPDQPCEALEFAVQAAGLVYKKPVTMLRHQTDLVNVDAASLPLVAFDATAADYLRRRNQLERVDAAECPDYPSTWAFARVDNRWAWSTDQLVSYFKSIGQSIQSKPLLNLLTEDAAFTHWADSEEQQALREAVYAVRDAYDWTRWTLDDWDLVAAHTVYYA
jgi:hypothetical protein